MMVKEAAILQEILGGCVQNNLLALQVSYLVPDMVRLSKTIIDELSASLESFLSEENKLGKLPKGKNKQKRNG
ncbi:MAG: hypothetical protein LAO76_05045 [Acidobacteriia bacterium]|nr:hypothetical protein [Terriglobia bacterium]